MSIAVIGAGGQLGQDLCPLLDPDVFRITRKDVDVTDYTGLEKVLTECSPDIVINLSACNLVDRCEEEPELAFSVNAIGVRNIAMICSDLDCRLIHVSTDYVFGMEADRIHPYEEHESPGPISVYGVSKLMGEFFVRTLCARHLVVRTCGLYGRAGSRGKGGNFVQTMLRLAGERSEISVVSDQVCTPSSTCDIAAGLVYLAGHPIEGICHLTNSGFCSWNEFAAEIFRITSKNVKVIPIRSVDFGAKARRPSYSVLSMSRYQSLGADPLPHWADSLAVYLESGI